LSLVVLTIFSIVASARGESPKRPADWRHEKQVLEERIEQQTITIGQLQEGLRAKQEQAVETVASERNVLMELEVLDTRLLTILTKLHDLEREMLAQQQQIAEMEAEIAAIQGKKERAQSHLQKRIAAYYKTGKIGMINVAFSADTLPKLLGIQDAFESLIRYDQSLLHQYRRTLAELEGKRKALILEKDLLASLIAQANQEKTDFEAVRQEKNELLAQVRTQSQLHQQAAKEIEQAAKDLESQLTSMKQKVEILHQEFLMHKGQLSAPVSGQVLARYGQSRMNKMGVAGNANGISIEAGNGTAVKAIYAGAVSFSGYLRGYGNTIIIDHGFQYYTVSARMEILLKEEGDTVIKGDEIGIMGETATLVEDGFYFEIRHGEKAEDPLPWIEKNELTLP